MTVAIFFESEVVRMCVLTKTKERRSLLSAFETIQVILGFGTFTIALIALVVELLKMTEKNNRQL
ncbi:putative holin-like toxin [Tetragenococcus halophilus]|nr:type I toxin-antitoxin system toxin PepG1 [Tetragenococcus halophilus]NWO00488.1 putative holin-like toxin [Tetragenococcus halophilus]